MNIFKFPSLLLLFALLLFAFNGCGGPKATVRIGVDPSFPSIASNGLSSNIYAFCFELFEEVAKETHLNLSIVPTSGDLLSERLKERRLDAILSASPAFTFTGAPYDTTPPILSTGPLLVVSKSVEASSLKDLSGQVIAIVSGSKDDLLLEGNPNFSMRYYPSVPEALNAVANGVAEGALVPYLFAQNYVHNLYQNTLKSVGNPLTQEGLRFITPKDEHDELFLLVQQTLSKFTSNGTLEKLRRKWGLTYF